MAQQTLTRRRITITEGGTTTAVPGRLRVRIDGTDLAEVIDPKGNVIHTLADYERTDADAKKVVLTSGATTWLIVQGGCSCGK